MNLRQLKSKLSTIIKIEKVQAQPIRKMDEVKEEYVDKRPKLKKLSEEEINSIHQRGNITAEEKVIEWEQTKTCAPGIKNDRCSKFNHNCHDCLIEYASNKKEYKSIKKLSKQEEPEFGFNIYDKENIMVMKKNF